MLVCVLVVLVYRLQVGPVKYTYCIYTMNSLHQVRIYYLQILKHMFIKLDTQLGSGGGGGGLSGKHSHKNTEASHSSPFRPSTILYITP
jgi:hypothetical protein